MAQKKEELQEARGLQRRASTSRIGNKKKPDDVSPKPTRKPKKAASSRKLGKPKPGGQEGTHKTRGSLLAQVSAIMGRNGNHQKQQQQLRSIAAMNATTNSTTPVQFVERRGSESGTVISEITTHDVSLAEDVLRRQDSALLARRKSVRQKDDSSGAEQPSVILRKPRKATMKKAPRNTTIPPPPPAASSPPPSDSKKLAKAAPSTLDFLQSLEAANQERKEEEQSVHNHNKTKKKKPLKKKISASRQRDIQNELAKRKQLKAKRKEADALHVEDDHIEQIGWFTMTLQETAQKEEEDSYNTPPTKKKKKKPKKELKSTCDYSRDYPFTTRQTMEDQPPGYYLHMVAVKKRQFHIDNLFTTQRPQIRLPRVYHFDTEMVHQILDKRDDKWWIQSRLPLYEQDGDSSQDDDEKGMEALSVYFGPNPIDDDDDDSVLEFGSIASVESVVFSDDDDDRLQWHGQTRQKVEVMPGEFKMIRQEAETYEAIREGHSMSSLCLGCGVALVSVQDAREVACPTCGSITPLNGVCLHKPFGIATGIKRSKVEHLLAATRKSPFVVEEAESEAILHSLKQKPASVPGAIAVSSNSSKPLEAMKVSELKAACKNRGIDITGMLEKRELIEALQKSNTPKQASKPPAPAAARASRPGAVAVNSKNSNNAATRDRQEREQRKMRSPENNNAFRNRSSTSNNAAAAKDRYEREQRKTKRESATKAGKPTPKRNGSSGVRVRPTNRAGTASSSSRGPPQAARPKVRPTKPAAKPGPVRVAAR